MPVQASRWRLRRRCAVVLLFVPLIAFADPAPNPAPAARGTVFVLTGIGGFEAMASHATAALDLCAVPYDVQHIPWCHGKGRIFKDLMDHDNVKRHADEFAAILLAAREKDRQRRICVLAWSGGVGVALGAAEQLPANTLDRIVLLCAGCSCTYDLRGALRASRGGIVSYRCILDHYYLNFLSHACGAIDRVHGPCAGLYGFRIPVNLCPEDQELYQNLVEVAWRPHMILDGHHGGHTGYKSTRFLTIHIVPWLR